MKKITCAIAIFTKEGLLLVHPTGGRFTGGWSLPKGLKDDNETDLEAACREVFEETGLMINKKIIKDHGIFPYTHEKDYHLFSCIVEKIEVVNLECKSTFLCEGVETKEVDQYKIVPDFAEVLKLLNKKQSSIFSKAFL